jgi:hypothetical protein
VDEDRSEHDPSVDESPEEIARRVHARRAEHDDREDPIADQLTKIGNPNSLGEA